MRKPLLTWAIFAVSVVGSFAATHRPTGFTIEQLRFAFGPEVQTEKPWCGGTAYAFSKDNSYIYVVFAPGSKFVGDVFFFKNDGSPVNDEDKAAIQKLVLKGGRWHASEFKDGYRGEPGYHRVDDLGSYTLIESVYNTGWRIRTLDQFLAEQHFAEKAEAAAKASAPLSK
jgi:hypothetical protein